MSGTRMYSNSFLAIVIGLIVVNQIAARSARFRSRAALFWTLQAVNVGLAIYLFVAGVPGITGQYAGFASFILGLLFLFRAAQNMIIVLESQREAANAVAMRQRDPSFQELAQASQEGWEDSAPTDPAEPVTAPPESPRS